MILEDGLIPFLLHLEHYLEYEKGHKIGHCHYLCLLLVHLLLSIPGSKLQDNVNLCFLNFCRHYYQLLHTKKELDYG